MSSPKREEKGATARTARDSDLLQTVERRLEQEARGALDPGSLDRARRRAQALTAAGGAGADAARAAALTITADVVVSLALERDWERDQVRALARDLGAALELAPELVTVELFVRALADARLAEPPPQLSLEAQLRLLAAFSLAEDVTVWVADEASRPRLLARVGAEPTRRMRAAAAETLVGREGPPAASIRAFPITRWERIEAALVVRAARNDRQSLVLAGELAARLSPTIERARLLERRSERESALLETAERRLARLGFDLHDGPVQEVFALGSELRLFRTQLARVLGGNRHAAILQGRVDDLEARLVALDGELRSVARSLETPTVLRTSLPELLRKEAGDLEARSNLTVELHMDGEFDSLTPSQAITILRVVQEALTNVETHAAARLVTVTVHAGLRELQAEIRDDGRGFEVERTLVDAARSGHLGLVGMSERVRLLDGRLDVESRPGGPTRISARIPRWRPPAS
jgi:two-component system sensor histidine kinase DegS